MDFSKPRNLILLIISLIVILSLSINASLAWFSTAANKNSQNTFSVLNFDFRTDSVFKEDVSITLNIDSPTNYVSGYIAPGVKGHHTFQFSNANSGVPVKYTVSFNRSASIFPENMVFYVDNDSSKTITSGNVWENQSLAKGASESKTFNFEWKFYTTDSANALDKTFKQNNTQIKLVFTVNAYQA